VGSNLQPLTTTLLDIQELAAKEPDPPQPSPSPAATEPSADGAGVADDVGLSDSATIPISAALDRHGARGACGATEPGEDQDPGRGRGGGVRGPGEQPRADPFRGRGGVPARGQAPAKRGPDRCLCFGRGRGDDHHGGVTPVEHDMSDARPMFNRASPTEASLHLYGTIGLDITAKEFSDALLEAKGVKRLNAYRDSPGGELFTGFTLLAQLERFAKTSDVVFTVEGLCASAATMSSRWARHGSSWPRPRRGWSTRPGRFPAARRRTSRR